MEASAIRPGTILVINNQLYRVDELAVKGTGQFGKTIHVKMRSIKDGTQIERSFKSEEIVQEAELQHVETEYLYNDGDNYYFMDLNTYEQYTLSKEIIGKVGIFLKENMRVKLEFYEGVPVKILFPETVDIVVKSTPPPVHGKDMNIYKPAQLENGLEIMVPQFIKDGDTVRVHVWTHKYIEKVKKEGEK